MAGDESGGRATGRRRFLATISSGGTVVVGGCALTLERTSAGCILYRDTRGRREYLLLRETESEGWEFPKGGIGEDETLQEAALRETREETGIDDARIVDGFREEYDYSFRPSVREVYKTVYLFLARSSAESVELTEEHSDYAWRQYDDAVDLVSLDGLHDAVSNAHAYLDTDSSEPAAGGATDSH